MHVLKFLPCFPGTIRGRSKGIGGILAKILMALSLIHAFSVSAFADNLVLISPHWEGIRYEFERAFKQRYQKDTGRTVELEWLDVGGSSETLRYVESEFKNKPAGIGIDIFFGGGYDP